MDRERYRERISERSGNRERYSRDRKPRRKETSGEGGFFSNWIVRNLIGAACFIVGVMLVASLILNIVTNHNKELTVPDFTNMSFQDAKRLAAINDVRLDITDSVYVRRMARGAVYRQNPTAGSSVKKGRRILLTINAVTPKKVSMPNLIGYSMRQAKSELLSRGLKLGNLIYVNDMATNNVLRQLCNNREILPGDTVESETEIDLVVGLNDIDNETYIPDLVGMKMLAATDAVHDNSLNIKKYVFDSSVSNYADSLNAVVIKQNPAPSDAPCKMGGEVTLYMSLGKDKQSK